MPRLTRLIEAWLSLLVSPFSRSEIGTAATMLFLGSVRCLLKWRRSALPTTIITMSLIVASWALPSALSSRSGKVTAAKARPAVSETLKGVFGASVRLLTPGLPPSNFELPIAVRAAPPRVPSVEGSSFTIAETCDIWLASAPRSISAMSRRKTFARFEAAASMTRGCGVTSRIAFASATAAWPSTAAWCSWV